LQGTHVVEDAFRLIVDDEVTGDEVDGGDEALEGLRRFLHNVNQPCDLLPLHDVSKNLKVVCVMSTVW